MPAASYNELFGLGSHPPDANLEVWCPLQDNAASTAVLDYSGNSLTVTLEGGDNTADLSDTGPNSWATRGIHLTPTADGIRNSSLSLGSGGTLSVLCRVRMDTVSAGDEQRFVSVGNETAVVRAHTPNTTAQFYTRVNTSTFRVTWQASAFAATTWYDCGLTYDGTNTRMYVGASPADQTESSGGTLNAVSGFGIGCKTDAASDERLDGIISDVSIWSRQLVDAEYDQWRPGPEPIVTSGSDSVSGTETVGETLSASGATWGLDSPFSAGSNGIITYTYQWTRSDDNSGTNEADIGGATSSTYTLQPADVGKYIRRRRRGTNDGGYDVAADHNSTFTGAIASAGTLLTTMLQHNHFAGGTAA